MSYWDDKKPCWKSKNCMGKPGKGEECIAYQYNNFPCWKVAGTLCKGESGKDIRECKSCEVYLNYGNGEPILCFDVTKIK